MPLCVCPWELLDFQRFGLLRLMGVVFAAEHMELLVHAPAQRPFRQHSLHREFDRGEGNVAERAAGPAHVQEAPCVRRQRPPPSGAATQSAGNLRVPKDRHTMASNTAANSFYGTGRRKTSSARVYLRQGTG